MASLNDVRQCNEHLLSKFSGVLYKWTNFVYGWQKRYFELENGILVYYKSESEKQYGSRGSIALRIARIVESDIDFYRFDLLTNGTCWYLRAENRKARNLWIRALRYQMNSRRSNVLGQQRSSGSECSAVFSGQEGSFNKMLLVSPGGCKTHYSADDLAKSTGSEQSLLSFELISKMEELERYNDMIARQTARLEKLIHTMKDNKESANTTVLLDESLALNAVTIAVLQNINTCVHLLATQTQAIRNRRGSENCQAEQSIIASNRSPSSVKMDQTTVSCGCESFSKLEKYHKAGLDSILSDDEQEWHDAHDSTPEKSGDEEKKRPAKRSSTKSSTQKAATSDDYADITESPPKKVTLPASNPFTEEINRIAMEQLKYAQASVEDNIWELFMEEGEMKMYKRELEMNGIAYDPLKAVHLVQGVSAREYIHYFFEPRYKYEWDETLVKTRVIERISMDTVIIHQLHKRVWPAAQRESLFWSNVRYLPEEKSPDALDLYMVCNHHCNLPNVPLLHSSNVRVGITVAMLCETLVKDGHERPIAELGRSDIRCRICYCAQVDPGGWVPLSALRIIYKREYPKFLRGFTKYVLGIMPNLKGVQVPFTRREWDIVTSLYQSEKASELKQAVALIVSWKARSGASVHVAADMTEMLLRAIIMDKETRNVDWFQIGNVQLAYCTAIIRFVNYVNEICQSDRHFKSIASAVSDVGIPQWVVDIRHGATHSHLPSLQSLREAANYCRNWLWLYHWSKPTAEAIGLDLNTTSENDENALQQKANSLIDLFMAYALRRKGEEQCMNRKLQNVLTEMETFIMTHPWEFLNVFLQKGYLIMDEEQVKSIDCNLFVQNQDIWIIPEGLQLFWKPIFHFLNEAKMLPELLCQLLETLLDSPMQSIQERQLVAWIDKMLSAYTESNVLTQAEWKRVLKAIMLVSGKLKEIYFNKVLVRIEKMTGKKQAALRQLSVLSPEKPTTSVAIATTAPAYSRNHISCRTVEDLRKLMLQKGEKQPGNPSCTASSDRWKTCNPLEWKGIPLGLTPEQSTESLYLVVEPEMIQIRKRCRDTQDTLRHSDLIH